MQTDSAPQPPAQRKTAAQWLFTAAVALFLIGIVALAALFLTPVFADGDTAPTIVYVLTMCAPLGFLVAVAAALSSGRRTR